MKSNEITMRTKEVKAISGSWGYTNTTASTHTLTPVAVDLATNYAKTEDSPGRVVFKNITSPIDQVECIIITSNDLNKISQEEKNLYPPKVQGGRLVSVKAEAKKRLTSTTDDSFIVDYPASCAIQFRFSRNSSISASDMETLLKRALGSIQNSDGTFAIDKLMLQQLDPTK